VTDHRVIDLDDPALSERLILGLRNPAYEGPKEGLAAVAAVLAVLRETGDPADPDGAQHVIEFREDGWTIRHPLTCRLGDLFACRVNRAAEVDVEGPPDAGLGRYVCDVDPAGSFHLRGLVADPIRHDDEPLLDPDCRDGKHASCTGGPCECTCHQEDPYGSGGAS
jgi:hypothetical protein